MRFTQPEITMKTSNPYGANYQVKVPPETIQAEQSQANSKAKARYPHTPLSPSTKNNEAGKMKTRALTPGTSPAGS
jgi:hypothetical protein